MTRYWKNTKAYIASKVATGVEGFGELAI